MKTAARTIAVIGDGGWGTALAVTLAARPAFAVRLWGAFPEYTAVLQRTRANPKFLPGVAIPPSVAVESDLARTLAGAELVILAVPSQHLRGVLRRAPAAAWSQATLVSAAKGIERERLCRMSEVIADACGAAAPVALSGPSLAAEVAQGHPTAVVAASSDRAAAALVQATLASDTLRIYTSQDVIGVELGGALKNPMAIAAGIADGLGFGANAKATLVTRAVVEMARLGKALGAHPETFWGLSGLGDLVTTVLGGRNRWLGLELGRGRALPDVLASTEMVIEGVETTRSALALARRCGVELPIIEQVHAILFEGKTPREALTDLMRRALHDE